MATVDTRPCPACGAPPGSLGITGRLDARPVGTFSLAGAGLKFSAVARPVLSCRVCGWSVAGRLDADGEHVIFPDPRAEER